jgi:hypothetical protein
MGQQITFALRQSVHRVLVVLVSFLPGLIALLLAILIFGALGLLLSAVIRRVLTAMKFDDRLINQQRPNSPASIADWASTHSPTNLLARGAFWLCLLLGVAIGIYAFNASYSSTATISLFLLPYFTHIVGAILILLGGGLLARFLSRSVLIGSVNAQLQYARFLALGVKWLVYVLAAAMALDHVQIGGTVIELAFGILFGGIVLTLSLAVGLGSRDLVSRSIERSMDKPSGPAEISPLRDTEAKTASRLRHF